MCVYLGLVSSPLPLGIQSTYTALLINRDRFGRRHVNPIEELPDILVTNKRSSPAHRARERDLLDIVTFDDELVLDGSVATGDRATVLHGDNTGELLSNKVTDLEDLAVIDNVDVDGEMSVHQPHLVPEALGHTSHHVLDVRRKGPDARQLLPLRVPRPDHNVLAVRRDLHGLVAELARERSAGAGDGHLPGLDGHSHCGGAEGGLVVRRGAHGSWAGETTRGKRRTERKSMFEY